MRLKIHWNSFQQKWSHSLTLDLKILKWNTKMYFTQIKDNIWQSFTYKERQENKRFSWWGRFKLFPKTKINLTLVYLNNCLYLSGKVPMAKAILSQQDLHHALLFAQLLRKLQSTNQKLASVCVNQSEVRIVCEPIRS